MRFSLTFIVALALAGAITTTASPLRSSDELSQIFEEFLALVPQDKVVEIFLEYLEKDEEVQNVIEYLQSESFKELVKQVESIKDVINFYDYLAESGLDVYGLVNKLHEIIGLPPLVPGGLSRHIRITGGVAGLIEDIKAILPVDKIKALYEEKLETSAAFAELVKRLQSPRFQELINALRANEEFKKIVVYAKEIGIDIKAITDLLSSILGLEFPASSLRNSDELNKIFEEFLALVPQDKVVEIFLEYLEKDEEVQNVIEYLQSESFKELVKQVESIDDVINFYDYLAGSGLDIYGLINKLHELIGLPPLVPGELSKKIRITGGVAGLIEDIKAILPVDKIKALYEEKLETSAAFAELVKRLQSPRFQELINALRANEEFKKIVVYAKEIGIDIKAITDLLSSILGLEFPASSLRNSDELNKIFEEFLALVPQDKVVEIFLEYLEKDEEVQNVIEYLQSESFKELVKQVESIDDVINFYDYLAGSGLDIYGLVNKLHDLIGLPPLVPGGLSRKIRITGGVAGLIEDIKAILPVDKIKALYEEKLETSAAFAELVKRLQSPRFQELINALRANEEFKKIVVYAKEIGIDIKAITDLLSSILGLEFPASSLRNSDELNKIFEEFLALVPQDKVVEIFLEYLEKDEEVQNVIEYLQSESFKELVKQVESIDDVINFYDYLAGSGLDIYGLVNKLHDLIGLPPLVPGGLSRKTRITGGVAGLIEDIKAILPVDKIKALYEEKLETSAAFAELVKRLQSPRFQELINALRANEEFKKIVVYAKEIGIDIKAITDLLSSILGLEFPASSLRNSDELNKIFEEFLALVPQDKVVEIFLEYLEKDEEVQNVIEYLQSESFKELVKQVESIDDVINFYDYLAGSGLDIYGLVNKLHELIGLPPLVPGGLSKKIRITGGVAGLIEDIKAILPVDKIKALYEEKLETSAAFAELVKRLQSPRFQELINALRANEEFKKIVVYAKEIGIDIKAITDLLSSILGLEFPASSLRNSDELNKIFEEFLALVPQDKVVEIFLEYLEKDEEVQNVIEYLQSESFKELVKQVESIDDVINFYDYLAGSGLDIYGLVNKLHDLIGLPPLVPGGLSRKIKITGGVAGLIEDIKAILPVDKIKALYEEKLETSAAFAELVKRLQSPRFQELINALRANEEFKKIVVYAKEIGIDIKAITDLLSSILGLEFPASSLRNSDELNKIFEEFLALVPQDKVVEIFLEYLEKDEEVQNVIEYLQSESFKELVKQVESIDDVINFYDYLAGSGLDIYGLVNKLHDLIGLPPLVPGGLSRKIKITGGVAGLIEDIKAILPVDKIKALYEEKLETSAAFAELVKRLQSPRFQELIDALRANEEFKKIVVYAKEIGIDIKAITDLLSSILGLEFPKSHVRAKRDLNDDLEDFINILPTAEISKIVLDYLENDPEILEVIAYLESNDFRQVVEEVEAMKEARDILAFLEESGLAAYDFLNSIHDLLGIPPFQPSFLAKKRVVKVGSGLKGLIADIKAILPIDKIKALYYEKLENSPSFAKLIERLSSQEFQDFVDNILAKEEVRNIIAKLKSHGVDVSAIADLLSTILGIRFPKPLVSRANDLVGDLADFLEILPLEDIIDIAVDYVFNDPEVQKAALYIKTDEFKKLATAAEQNDEFRNFLGYLDKSGLPATTFINYINNALDLPEVTPSGLRRAIKAGGGVRGMLDAIESVLPREEIKKLYEDKKANSEAFKYFIERLESPEFQAIVDLLVQNEDFQKLGYKAADFGIDLVAIVEFLSRVFGIKIPDDLLPLSTRSLEDDLQEFIDLLPRKKLHSIVVKYVVLDKEVKAALQYLRSDEFTQLVNDLHHIPEYNDILNTLREAGLEVDEYIRKIHQALGIPNNVLSRYSKKTGGFVGLINELKANLPTEEIKALYIKKLESSKDFADLVELISSDKFQAVTDALFANKIFQDMLHRIQSHGIDLNVVADFFFNIFGITTPPGIIDLARRQL